MRKARWGTSTGGGDSDAGSVDSRSLADFDASRPSTSASFKTSPLRRPETSEGSPPLSRPGTVGDGSVRRGPARVVVRARAPAEATSLELNASFGSDASFGGGLGHSGTFPGGPGAGPDDHLGHSGSFDTSADMMRTGASFGGSVGGGSSFGATGRSDADGVMPRAIDAVVVDRSRPGTAVGGGVTSSTGISADMRRVLKMISDTIYGSPTGVAGAYKRMRDRGDVTARALFYELRRLGCDKLTCVARGCISAVLCSAALVGACLSSHVVSCRLLSSLVVSCRLLSSSVVSCRLLSSSVVSCRLLSSAVLCCAALRCTASRCVTV
jgi:hypothetical protein